VEEEPSFSTFTVAITCWLTVGGADNLAGAQAERRVVIKTIITSEFLQMCPAFMAFPPFKIKRAIFLSSPLWSP
jgi:hypothetical protein